jgi:hypothetical protein
MAQDQNLTAQPVMDTQSFTTHYKYLTNILNKCANDTFGQGPEMTPNLPGFAHT